MNGCIKRIPVAELNHCYTFGCGSFLPGCFQRDDRATKIPQFSFCRNIFNSECAGAIDQAWFVANGKVKWHHANVNKAVPVLMVLLVEAHLLNRIDVDEVCDATAA